MSASKHVTFISDGKLAPATRFRVDPVLARLQERGWEGRSVYGYGVWDQSIGPAKLRKAYRSLCRIKRAVFTASLKTDGPVLVQRLAIPILSYPEVRLAQRSAGLVLDFDDAMTFNSKLAESPLRSKAYKQAFQAAQHVVAGNAWLAGTVPSGCDVTIIPSCLDTTMYTPSVGRPEDEVVRIGWMGTYSNFVYLSQLIEPLAALRRKFGSKFEFVICSDQFDRPLFERLEAKFIRWTAEMEVETLQSFDIGLMPLAEKDWSRGKCSFKLIQYMAVGIASVSTPVGMNLEVVTDGVDGLFAHQGDWFGALDALIGDSDRRLQMGINARKVAEQRFSLDVAVNAYERIFSNFL